MTGIAGLCHFFPIFFSKPIFPKNFGKLWKKLEKLEKLFPISELISEGTRSLGYDISDAVRALFLHGRSPI